MSEVLQVDYDGRQLPGAGQVPMASELSIPATLGDSVSDELAATAREWTEVFARASGHLVYFGGAP